MQLVSELLVRRRRNPSAVIYEEVLRCGGKVDQRVRQKHLLPAMNDSILTATSSRAGADGRAINHAEANVSIAQPTSSPLAVRVGINFSQG